MRAPQGEYGSHPHGQQLHVLKDPIRSNCLLLSSFLVSIKPQFKAINPRQQPMVHSKLITVYLYVFKYAF